MNARRHTPTIEMRSGERRASITRTSRPHRRRSTHRRRSRSTPRLSRTCWGWPPIPSRSMPTRASTPGRLVLVDDNQFEWQRARYREGRYLFAPADPVLVGLNTLQHWLWSRIGSPSVECAVADA